MKGKRVSILRGSWHVVAAIIAFSVFTNLLVLTLPLYMLQLFDRVMGSGSMETLAVLTLAATGALIVYACFEALRTQLLNRLGMRIEVSLGELVLNATMAKIRRGDSRSPQAIRDLHEVRQYYSGNGFTTLLDAPFAPFFVIVIFFFHPYLGSIAALGAAILFGLGLLSNFLSREPMMEASEHRERAMRRAETLVRNSDVVRSMGMTPTVLDRWRSENEEHLVPIAKATDRIGYTGAAGKFVRMILQISLLGTGVVLALQDAITPGVMIASSIMMGRALAPVERTVAGWKGLVSAWAARDRLKALLQEFVEQPDLVDLPEPEARLSCENLTFWLPGSDKPIIYNINFSLEPGEAMGIIGPSGAGKSTLARVLVGLDEPNSNLDPDGEERLADAVENAKARGCALILVTHRLSILSRMDKVLLLKDGMQAAIGPPNEILLQVQEAQRREKVIGPQKLSVIEKAKPSSAAGAA